MNKRSKKGFSLLEVLVAAGIVMVLTSVGVASYNSVNKRSRDARRTSDIEQIRTALEMYRADVGSYPAPAANRDQFATAANLAAILSPTYLPSVPVDPRDSSTQRYFYQALNASSGQYYGYCLCGKYEVQTGTSTCTVSLPTDCSYGQKSP